MSSSIAESLSQDDTQKPYFACVCLRVNLFSAQLFFSSSSRSFACSDRNVRSYQGFCTTEEYTPELYIFATDQISCPVMAISTDIGWKEFNFSSSRSALRQDSSPDELDTWSDACVAVVQLAVPLSSAESKEMQWNGKLGWGVCSPVGLKTLGSYNKRK